MVRKIVIGFGILCGVFFVLLIIARITGMIQFYRIPTTSNEPNIKKGDKIFASNKLNPSSKKFLVFKSQNSDSINTSYNPDYKSGSIYLHRLCAVAGDIIKMKDGVLFVNNKNFDEGLNLRKHFKISTEDFYLIEPEDILENDPENQNAQMSDSSIINFDRKTVEKYQSKIKFIPYIVYDTLFGPFKWLDKNSVWTTDNFGPLKIPNDCYFVLGDNRHNAQDSRYIGFVKKEDIKGVMMGKY